MTDTELYTLWEEILDNFKTITSVPMRDKLEYQACTYGVLDTDLIDFCRQYEKIQEIATPYKDRIEQLYTAVRLATLLFKDDIYVCKELIYLLTSQTLITLCQNIDKD